MEERAERLALYIIENRATVRAAAQKFGISKSTVHMDVTKGNGRRPHHASPEEGARRPADALFRRSAPGTRRPVPGAEFCRPPF